ncbi:M64 family metallopeptidase [Streptomyces sp. NPDC005077]|uniref:M64 family metallopeptidase n=1 Tax=Streptomyces sp. NPDC005077 TaxID=3154292 RepID=UPI0033A60567
MLTDRTQHPLVLGREVFEAVPDRHPARPGHHEGHGQLPHTTHHITPIKAGHLPPDPTSSSRQGHPFGPRTPVPTPANPPTGLTPAHHHSLQLSKPTAAHNPSYGTWPGGETDGPNKWYRWLGQSDPTGSTVGTYEGSAYYPYGLYRPTSTSIMRELSSTDFNLPGREAMIAGFYRAGNALSTTLDTDTAIKHGKRIQVSLAVGTTGLAGRICAGTSTVSRRSAPGAVPPSPPARSASVPTVAVTR